MDSLKSLSNTISRYAKKSLFSSKPCYTEAIAQRTYVARNEEELSLYPGDVIRNIARKHGSWWKGELRGKCGLFHEKNVMFLPQDKEKQHPTDQRKTSKGQPKQYAKVLFSYIPINEDEFKLEVGDIIEVCEEVEDGWWSGILGDQFGVFPSNYVVMLEDKDGGDNDEEIFDSVKRQSPKLTHLTITRPKVQAKRKPPSKRVQSSIVKQAIALFESSTVEKLNCTEECLFADCEENIKENGIVGNENSLKQTNQQSKQKVVVQPNVFTELKQKLRDLENEIDDLKSELALLQKNYASKTEHQKLKIEVSSLRQVIVTHRQYCSKLMSDLMCEVDEEKKLRSIVQIQLDRIMKLLTCTCSKVVMSDMLEDSSWKDTSV